jgi:rubrerythrin
MKLFSKFNLKYFVVFVMFFATAIMYARLGGGGGGHSSGGHYGGHSGGGGDGGLIYILFRILGFKGIAILVILYLIYQWYSNKNKKQDDNYSSNNFFESTESNGFPDGLPKDKIATAFLEMQKAWQNQDLGTVRKWMTDGLYQKLSVQIKMMLQLQQHNVLDNLQIENIKVEKTYSYNEFEIADIRINFVSNDRFFSDKYRSMNETFEEDYASEIYSFIKKGNKINADSNLYNDNNCPNCGAVLEHKMGDICRCSSCKTLTNNPEYDWVLCEITQIDNYGAQNPLNQDANLKEVTRLDTDFNIQSLEDVASNITMQVLDVISGGKNIKLNRFAHKDLADYILGVKTAMNNIVFDRLYLNEVTATGYNITTDNKIEIDFYVEACAKRVKIDNEKLTTIDSDIKTFKINLSLIKSIQKQQTDAKDVVYSYECSSCGAPFDDTTHDTCNYCDAVVLDENRNWILSKIELDL